MRALSRSLAAWLGHPLAFLVLAVGVLAWWLYQPDSLADLRSWAAIIAIGMTISIQRAQVHDTAAIQAKLDELILATGGARDELTALERKELREIQSAHDDDGEAVER